MRQLETFWLVELLNTFPSSFGAPEAAIVIEEVIDRIAEYLVKDPALVRKHNLTRYKFA